ncbi:MAG: hypothetical protein AB1778_02045, partial [Candidatus Bipolaricaulota bacterium]
MNGRRWMGTALVAGMLALTVVAADEVGIPALSEIGETQAPAPEAAQTSSAVHPRPEVGIPDVQTPSIVAGEAIPVAQTPSLTASSDWAAEIDGRKTWTLRYGLGDPLALAGASLSSGRLELEQTLAVDLRADALSILHLEGHFDDQEPEALQSLVLSLDTQLLDGTFGDFSAPSIGAFSSYSRQMKGVRLDAFLGDVTVTGIASRLEGVRATQTFVGETASGTRTFIGEPGTAYLSHLDGLAHAALRSFAGPEFADARMVVETGETVSRALAEFGVSDLGPAIAEHEGRELG